MGFYPYMQGKVDRITEKGERKVRAQAFHGPLNKWIIQDFPGYDPTEALAWISEKMKQLEM